MKKFTYIQILTFAILLRLILFIFFSLFPVYHEKFGFISPISYQIFADLEFYLNFKLIFDFSLSSLSEFINTYKNILLLNFDQVSERYPGVFFSFLILITNYSDQNPFILSAIIFLTEIISLFIWGKYLCEKFSNLSFIIYAFLPIPLLFGFLHSTDVLFFLLSSLIFLKLKNYYNYNYFFLFILMILLVLIRPAAITVIFCALIYFIYNNEKKIYILITAIILLSNIIYYLPYFIIELDIVNYKKPFKAPTVYTTKLFLLIPDIFQFEFLKSIIKYCVKFVFLFGFHPSSSGNFLIYVVRFCCALIFITGYIHSLKKKNIDFIYINLIIIPVVLFLYPSYRYILPIVPLLILNFCILIYSFSKNR